MFQAYGLYGHIQANRIRSVLLLAGFVALLHALLFSLLLIWSAFLGGTFDEIVAGAVGQFGRSWPVAMIASLRLVRHRLFRPPDADRHGDRRQGRHPHPGAQALQRAGEPVHLARAADAGAADHRHARAQRLRLRPARGPVRGGRHARPRRHAGRRRAGGRAGARAHPHPQPRHPADGDRRHLRRHLRLLRRHDHPRLGLPLRLVADARGASARLGMAAILQSQRRLDHRRRRPAAIARRQRTQQRRRRRRHHRHRALPWPSS